MYVKFLVRKTGAVVEKLFNTYDAAMNFVHKLEHSNDCMVISYGKVGY